MSGKQLIVNADDFGLSPGVTRGILDAFRNGIVTSTTMLVNLPYFDEAAQVARQHPELGVGIHLSLVWGTPVAPASRVPTLVDRNGRFPRKVGDLVKRYLLGKVSLSEIRVEFRSQIGKFLDAGLTPTHLDTHMHIHCLPGIFEALCAEASTFGINMIRIPRAKGLAPTKSGKLRGSVLSTCRRELIGFLCRNHIRKAVKYKISSSDHFTGIEQMDNLNAQALRFILHNLRDGITELMCHPGFTDEIAASYSSQPPFRERELEALTDSSLGELVRERSIELTNYRAL